MLQHPDGVAVTDGDHRGCGGATRKDSQYRAAETTLLKQVQAAGGTDKKAYNPTSANLPAALGTP